MADRDEGAIALLVLAGGGLVLLLALVLVVAVADLFISRGQAQLAADAAALAAMHHAAPGVVAVPGPGTDAGAWAGSAPARPQRADVAVARRLAEANGGRLVDCCGADPARREVVVAVAPRSALLRAVLPQVRARAAAALEAIGPSPAFDVVAGPTAGQVPPGTASPPHRRVWPVDATVSSGFGTRTHPLTGQRRLHAGLDLAAPTGTPVRVAAAGQVVSAGAVGGYGLTADVRHADGSITRYAHQSRLLVRAGQAVAAGQVIGLVGSTGNSTGPHLHFEVRTAAGPIDPLGWLPQG